jgi:hypothetical protein
MIVEARITFRTEVWMGVKLPVPETSKLSPKLLSYLSPKLLCPRNFPDTHLLRIMPGTFHPTLTTTALYRSSSGWFETRS